MCFWAPQGDSLPAGDDSPFADTVTLEQKTSSIGGTSGKVSLWMQWMLPKVTVKLFAPDPAAKKTGSYIHSIQSETTGATYADTLSIVTAPLIPIIIIVTFITPFPA